MHVYLEKTQFVTTCYQRMYRILSVTDIYHLGEGPHESEGVFHIQATLDNPENIVFNGAKLAIRL